MRQTTMEKNRFETETFSQIRLSSDMCELFLFSRSPDLSLLEPIRVRPPVNNPDTAHKVISFLFS